MVDVLWRVFLPCCTNTIIHDRPHTHFRELSHELRQGSCSDAARALVVCVHGGLHLNSVGMVSSATAVNAGISGDCDGSAGSCIRSITCCDSDCGPGGDGDGCG